jgi:hypothetical protein
MDGGELGRPQGGWLMLALSYIGLELQTRGDHDGHAMRPKCSSDIFHILDMRDARFQQRKIDGAQLLIEGAGQTFADD